MTEKKLGRSGWIEDPKVAAELGNYWAGLGALDLVLMLIASHLIGNGGPNVDSAVGMLRDTRKPSGRIRRIRKLVAETDMDDAKRQALDAILDEGVTLLERRNVYGHAWMGTREDGHVVMQAYPIENNGWVSEEVVTVESIALDRHAIHKWTFKAVDLLGLETQPHPA